MIFFSFKSITIPICENDMKRNVYIQFEIAYKHNSIVLTYFGEEENYHTI